LLFEFMSRKLGVAPADLQLEQLDAISGLKAQR
jgi:hypothetical protein